METLNVRFQLFFDSTDSLVDLVLEFVLLSAAVQDQTLFFVE
jgi:hypothetical protein